MSQERIWMSILMLAVAFGMAGCNTSVGCFEVKFPDPNLEQFVRINLGELESGNAITNCMLQKIELISSAEFVPIPEGSQIKDLTGIEHLTNVTKISFSFNQIEDLSPLAKLTKLESLHLSQNKITDIQPLADLKNLTKLFLSANNIEDIVPLTQLKNLEWLILIENQIVDITPLVGLESLTLLRLNQNEIESVSALTQLSNLTELNLSHNQVQDIEAFAAVAEKLSGASLDITDNPLNEESINVIVPFLRAQGVEVKL
jgi:internalin A